MPFRPTFDCLWCGTPWTTRGPDDLEGWAQLCPDCIGRAGENGFLRFRLRAALEDRGRAGATPATGPSPTRPTPASGAASAPVATPATVTAGPGSVPADVIDEMVAYYRARTDEHDDWYLRRGRYEHGPIHDQAWAAELDQATRWLDGLPLAGEIVELAAGTGWWSPLLASKGSLSCYDAAAEPLERARERLLAHGLRAHLHVRDAWVEPDRPVDAVFCGFWLSHVPSDRLDPFLALVRRWLRPGGTFAFIDSRPDRASGAVDQPPRPTDGSEVVRRRLADGREFRVVRAYHAPVDLETRLRAAGFADARVETTARFFLLGRGA